MKRIYLSLSILLLFALQAIAANRLTITAHTGAWDNPDNSMQFINYAVAQNPDIIEIDVRLRPDGSLVMSHDAIASNSEGEYVCKAFQKIRGTKIRMNLDIKMPTALKALRQLIGEYGLQKQVFMTGLKDGDIPMAIAECKGIRYYTNCEVDPLEMEKEENQQALIAKLKKQHSLGVNCHFKYATQTLCNLLHRHGYKLSVWTVNDAKVAKRMIALGVDNITTRKPDVVKAAYDEFQQHRIGKGKPFTFIQFTDPQFGFGKSMEADRDFMKQAVSYINKTRPPFVVCTGDMVHKLLNQETAEEYISYQHLISKDIQVYNIPGNHDISKLTPEFLDFYRKNYGEDRFSFRYAKCAFIGINSTIIHQGESAMEQQQYEWLESELKKARKCRSIILFSHIPLVCQDMQEPEDYHNYPTKLRQKYLSLLEKYGVRLMLCGHLHKNLHAKVNNLEIIVCNAVGNAFTGKQGLNVIQVGKDWINCEYMNFDELK